MKILFLAAGSSIHTIRWVNALAQAGLEIVLATQHEPREIIGQSVTIRRLPHAGSLGYFRNASALRRIIADETPDLVNAHYASGYGTTARLAGFAPTLLSVWGSDIYDFPASSPLHRWWLRGNLSAATKIASTSHAMASQTRQLKPGLGDIAVTPFGVDINRFNCSLRQYSDPRSAVVIGTVKTLSKKYGIDTILESVALLQDRLRPAGIADRLRLRIIGDGPQRAELERQAERLGLAGMVHFTGPLMHKDIPAQLKKLDIFVALSRLDSESFGVAIIEAGACGLPVVVSDVGGLPEVVEHRKTGIVVPKENPPAAAAALHELVINPRLRQSMGKAARERVATIYDWDSNVRDMIGLYEQLIAASRQANLP